jgi:hypothetical protein
MDANQRCLYPYLPRTQSETLKRGYNLVARRGRYRRRQAPGKVRECKLPERAARSQSAAGGDDCEHLSRSAGRRGNEVSPVELRLDPPAFTQVSRQFP